MEEVIKIEGKHELEGTVRISGSKNATVALIPAAILAVIFGAVIDLLQKKVTPRGLRKEAGK